MICKSILPKTYKLTTALQRNSPVVPASVMHGSTRGGAQRFEDPEHVS